jgi:hypothetical protein
LCRSREISFRLNSAYSPTVRIAFVRVMPRVNGTSRGCPSRNTTTLCRRSLGVASARQVAPKHAISAIDVNRSRTFTI